MANNLHPEIKNEYVIEAFKEATPVSSTIMAGVIQGPNGYALYEFIRTDDNYFVFLQSSAINDYSHELTMVEYTQR